MTENIGLARLADGLELVRIGRALWPEFASWRYGDQFGRRRIRRLTGVSAGVLVLAGTGIGGVMTGATMLALSGSMWSLAQRIIYGSPESTVARISIDDRRVEISRAQADRIRLVGDKSDPWRMQLQDNNFRFTIYGEDAERAAAAILPKMNLFGGTQREVRSAVDLIERAGDPMSFVEIVRTSLDARRGVPIRRMPYPMRLALEMAAHEDAERRALRGELKALELAWKEAEEIAAISDQLLTPAGIRSAIDRMRSAIS